MNPRSGEDPGDAVGAVVDVPGVERGDADASALDRVDGELLGEWGLADPGIDQNLYSTSDRYKG